MTNDDIKKNSDHIKECVFHLNVNTLNMNTEKRDVLNEEESKILNEFFSHNSFSKEVVDSLWRFCTKIKKYIPEAVLYTTQASILFRTKISENGSAFSLTPTKEAYCFSSDYEPKEDNEDFNELMGEIRDKDGKFYIVCNPCLKHPEVTDDIFFDRAIIEGVFCWRLSLLYEARKKVNDCPQVFLDTDYVAATCELPCEDIAQIMVEMLQNHPNEAQAILKEYFSEYNYNDSEDPLNVYLLENCPQIVPYFSLYSFIGAYQAEVEIIDKIVELGEWNHPFPGYMIESILECDFSLVDKLDYSGVEKEWNELVSEYFDYYIEKNKEKTD